MVLFHRIAVVCVVFCLSLPVAAQDDRNFAGRWVLNQNASEVRALPQPPDAFVSIDQHADTIKWSKIGEPASAAWIFNTAGAEERHQSGGTIVSSRTKWEGSALLTNTIVSTAADNYTVMDHWQLSRDRNKLSIEREVVGRSGSHEGVLIYDRERADGALPTPVTSNPPSPYVPKKALQPRSDPIPAPDPVPAAVDYVVKAGTHLPLRLINSVSTKHSSPGDHVYLETVYPILSRGRIVIPPGSYVVGSVSDLKRAGKVKGKSEMFLRFDSLTLPNGTTRDFRARLSQSDAAGNGKLGEEGKIQGESGKGPDGKNVATATAVGTGIGAVVGGAAGHLGMGAGIGAAAGAVGGLIGVLGSRGPDAVLEKGSTVEMVLDRDLTFSPAEIQP